jgi:DNA-directed RNA polymerase subunit M/transcription elongation factor TFIIS
MGRCFYPSSNFIVINYKNSTIIIIIIIIMKHLRDNNNTNNIPLLHKRKCIQLINTNTINTTNNTANTKNTTLTNNTTLKNTRNRTTTRNITKKKKKKLTKNELIKKFDTTVIRPLLLTCPRCQHHFIHEEILQIHRAKRPRCDLYIKPNVKSSNIKTIDENKNPNGIGIATIYNNTSDTVREALRDTLHNTSPEFINSANDVISLKLIQSSNEILP